MEKRERERERGVTMHAKGAFYVCKNGYILLCSKLQEHSIN
jgi:putative heme iron utilization protein